MSGNYKVYVTENTGDNVKLSVPGQAEIPEGLLNELSSVCKKMAVEIDYAYSYSGYDEDDDSYKKEQVNYSLEKLLEDSCCVGCLYFHTGVAVDENGNFAGAVIEYDGQACLLEAGVPQKFSKDEKYYAHAESSTDATFTLISE